VPWGPPPRLLQLSPPFFPETSLAKWPYRPLHLSRPKKDKLPWRVAPRDDRLLVGWSRVQRRSNGGFKGGRIKGPNRQAPGTITATVKKYLCGFLPGSSSARITNATGNQRTIFSIMDRLLSKIKTFFDTIRLVKR
jgi:hypothetical protein